MWLVRFRTPDGSCYMARVDTLAEDERAQILSGEFEEPEPCDHSSVAAVVESDGSSSEHGRSVVPSGCLVHCTITFC